MNLVINGQFDRGLTLNFKVIHQGHMIYSEHFWIPPDLKNVRNNANLIASTHPVQTISWLTHDSQLTVFTTIVVDFWRLDIIMSPDGVKLMSQTSAIPSNRYDKAIFALGIVRGEMPGGVRGLIFGRVWFGWWHLRPSLRAGDCSALFCE